MANLACGNSGLGLVHALTSAPDVHLPHGYQNGVLLPHVAAFNRPVLDGPARRRARRPRRALRDDRVRRALRARRGQRRGRRAHGRPPRWATRSARTTAAAPTRTSCASSWPSRVRRRRSSGGFGVPHTPHYPSIVANGGPGAEEIAALYGEVRTRLEAAAAGRDRLPHERPLQPLLGDVHPDLQRRGRAVRVGGERLRHDPAARAADRLRPRRARAAPPRPRRLRRRQEPGARARPHDRRADALPRARRRHPDRPGVRQRAHPAAAHGRALPGVRAGAARGARRRRRGPRRDRDERQLLAGDRRPAHGGRQPRRRSRPRLDGPGARAAGRGRPGHARRRGDRGAALGRGQRRRRDPAVDRDARAAGGGTPDFLEAQRAAGHGYGAWV